MAVSRFIILKGEKSMTGIATANKFPGQGFDEGEDFQPIMDELKEGGVLSVLPIWNSHVGVIQSSKIIEAVIAEELLIHAIWPDWIRIALIVRQGTEFDDITKVASMGGVIDKQCSAFLNDNGFTGDAFIPERSTQHAYDKFCEDQTIDSVLCSAVSCEPEKQQEILRDDVANFLNFTSFVLIGHEDSDEWSRDSLSVLCDEALPKSYSISCIEMPAIKTTLSDQQHALFEIIIGDCEHINEIPKIIFAAERDLGAKVALLLEYETGGGAQGFPDVSHDSDIYIVDDAGSTGAFYADEVKALLDEAVEGFSDRHFVKHIGTAACFFACPPLNIVVHGFNAEVVEAVTRKSIELHREAFNTGLDATGVQSKFLNNYKDEYMEAIEFEEVQ